MPSERSAIVVYAEDEHKHVRESLTKPFPSTPGDDNQSFLRLFPVELTCHVIPFMDMKSVFHFRRVSRLAREIVSGHRRYHIIITHALDCFRAMLAARTARNITLTRLYVALHRRYCEDCGWVSGAYFVSLRDASRCCITCMQMDRRLWAIDDGTLADKYNSPTRSFPRETQNMRKVPGVYLKWDAVRVVGPIASEELASEVGLQDDNNNNNNINAGQQSAALYYRRLAISELVNNANPYQYCFHCPVNIIEGTTTQGGNP